MELQVPMVGIFDSGSGGMSVLKEVRNKLPNLDIMYLGDTLRAPYGNRTEEEVKEFTKEILLYLKGRGCTHFVSACNSISAMVTDEILAEVAIPRERYIDMILPTKEHFTHNPKESLFVLATVLTTKSGIYRDSLSSYVKNYTAIGEPDLARAIEYGEGDETVRNIIQKVFVHIPKNAPSHLLLACTHYPLVRDLFEEHVEKYSLPVTIIDPALYVAEEVVKRVEGEGRGIMRIFATKESPTLSSLGSQYGILNHEVVTL